MVSPLLLVDSDLFALLSAVGLLDELVAELGMTPDNVRRLPALLTQLQPEKTIGRKFRELEIARQNAVRQCSTTLPFVDPPTDPSVARRLAAVPKIDDGEVLLLAALAEHPGWLLTTGDKRCLVALGQERLLEDVRERIRGRIIPLEVALVLLVRRLGAAEVGRRFQSVPGLHKTIDVLFRHKTEFDDDRTLAEITSYLDDLHHKIGDDLLFPL
jgi:hypothetical protein